ncbi:hypothetical protein NC651_009391 [Populus alba x Populus x berolinensis]|nr:hypothetical protein NC651_009391 [Populus alba x Populus x berolinensis]
MKCPDSLFPQQIASVNFNYDLFVKKLNCCTKLKSWEARKKKKNEEIRKTILARLILARLWRVECCCCDDGSAAHRVCVCAL